MTSVAMACSSRYEGKKRRTDPGVVGHRIIHVRRAPGVLNSIILRGIPMPDGVRPKNEACVCMHCTSIYRVRDDI